MKNEEQKQKRPAELLGEQLRKASSDSKMKVWLEQELERRREQENQDYITIPSFYFFSIVS